MKTFSVIGAGRAGRAVARLMRRAPGWRCAALSCRTAASARAARRFVGAGRAVTENAAAARAAGLVILAVPDAAILPVWREIAPHLAPRAVAFHLCGNEPATLLRPVPPGVRVGAVHPLRSFADPDLAVKCFPGTFCAVEGPPLLDRLVRAWGGVPLRVDPRAKRLYHAAAVFATNYVVAALDAAVELLGRSNVPRRRALDAALAMAGGTLRNLGAVGLPRALTGPIERGDADTVARHLDALAARDGRLVRLYAELARRTCRVARAKGTPAARLRRIERLLESK
jgi:predicted short-subunit dehydrogenase-like oxidoreductase (DUF2520 family)